MRKKVIALVISLGLLITLVGCDYDIAQAENFHYGNSMFITIERAEDWNIVYHNKTKVMYAVSKDAYNCGNFALLVDADGKPMLYKGEEK